MIIRFPSFASEYRKCFDKPPPMQKAEVVNLYLSRSMRAKQRERRERKRLRVVEAKTDSPDRT